MKLSMAQISASENMDDNIKKFNEFANKAKGSDLLFFPEIQLSPFFPQYEKRNADKYLLDINSSYISEFSRAAKDNNIYISPNVYLEENGEKFDTSLWINPNGEIEGSSKMVHVLQASQFYEEDYYTPSKDGFKVFDTPWGKVGIVICFDRHMPESIRTVALMGADLVIIPTANCKAEPMEMFEWEIRVQAMQNQVFIAMCNRVGLEGEMDFAGESIVISPEGDVIYKADDKEQLITVDINLKDTIDAKKKRPFLGLRRKDMYL